MNKKDKKVAIILLNYKDYAKRFLSECIKSLRDVKFEQGKFEIFIADNETSEETQKYIKEIAPEAKLIANKENLGFAGGNNSVVKEIEDNGYDYYLFLNMDVEVEPDFLDKLVHVAQTEENVGTVQSRIMLHDEKEKINSLGNMVHYLGLGFAGGYGEKYSGQNISQEIVYSSGCSLLISSEVFKKIDGFTDEFFMYHDDLEIGLKTRMLGLKNYIALKSVVYHKYEFSRSIKKYYWMERNRQILFLMLYKTPTLILFFPAWIGMELGQMLFALKGGWWKEKVNVYKWFLNWDNLNKLLNWREKTQQLRKVKDKDLMKGFVGRISFQDSEVDNWVVQKIGNPVFDLYFQVSKFIMFW